MKRFTAGVAAAVLVFAGLAAMLQGSMPAVSAGEWAPGPILTQARDGAAAVPLADGRLLVIGGRGVDGPVATVDVVGTDGVVTAGPSLAVARAGHVAIGLDDGRVLVAGGRTLVDDGSGPVEVVTGSVEILDAGGNAWTAAGALAEARAGAVGVALPDGAALVAGGDGADGPLASYEVFDPAAGGFAGGGILSAARADASGDVLGDGRVVVVGGTDGAIVLATADVIDPVQGTVSQVVLSGPRAAASATTLIDGTVLVAGGTDGADDLATTEVLDPATGIATAGPALASARRGHRAWRLPHNNAVLLVGGTAEGAIVAAAEQVIPWQGVSTGAGAASLARDGAAGGAVAEDGLFLVAGGATDDGLTASTEFYGFVTLKTDKDDYAPGQTVTMSGGGWQPGEEVTLVLQEAPHPEWHPDRTYTVVADGQGNIVNTEFAPEEHHLGVRFYLTATGVSGTAHVTFTDAVGLQSVAVSPASVTVTAGAAANYTVTVGFNGSGSTGCVATLTAIGLPAGATPAFGTNPFASNGADQQTTLSVTTIVSLASGTYPFTVQAVAPDVAGGQGCNGATRTASATLVVEAGDITAPTTTITLNPGTPNGANGWYVTDVGVTVAATDNAGGSGVAETRCVLDPPAVPADFEALPPGPCAFSSGADVTTDGMHVVYAASIDTAGNKETPVKVASFKIDKTAPVSVVVNADRPPDQNGWYNAAFTATWTGSDATSGIASCTVTPYNGPDTATGLLSGSCTDNAGNESPSVDFNFQYDATAPVTVGGAPDRAPDHNGWYNAAVNVAFTGTDPTSGIDTCTVVPYSGPDGTGLTVLGSCTDVAGNTSAEVASNAFKFDATAPVIAFQGQSPAANGNGWNKTNVTLSWTCTDATSGPAASPVTQLLTLEGTGQSATGTCYDQAGNSASSTDGNVNIDLTAPVVTISMPASGGTYVLNQALASSYTCTDALSGVATCAGPVASGANADTGSVGAKSFTVDATDLAGNAAQATNSYAVQFASGGTCFGSPGHQILQPINVDGTSVFKQKSTVPAKFRVCDANGVSIGSSVVSAFYNVMITGGTYPVLDELPVDSTTPDTAFRWSATDQQWIFNINTKGLSANRTYHFEIRLTDGTVIPFRFGLK